MANLRDIKNRIQGVKNTQQITRAMKMVAAARLRRAQDNMVNARPYSRKIAEVLSHLLSLEQGIDNPLLKERPAEKIALVCVTGDRGLCGAFNSNVIRFTENIITEKYYEQFNAGNLNLFCIGRRGADYFRRLDFPIAESYPGFFSNLQFELVAGIVSNLKEKFLNGTYDKVVVVYNQFKSVMQQVTVEEQLFPIMPFDGNSKESKYTAEYIYEPNKTEIINYLLPKHSNALMWKTLLESYAAELGARMTAMDIATENAQELVKELRTKFNKERQANITTEILEVVSGADALRAG